MPVQVNAFGSLLTPFFTTGPVRDYQSALTADTQRYAVFFRGMLARGIYPAAIAVRSLVPVGRAHAQGRRADDQSSGGGDERGGGEIERGSGFEPRTSNALAHLKRLLEPDAQDRTGIELDVLALGGRDGAAAADQDAEQCAFAAADDPADDRAHG